MTHNEKKTQGIKAKAEMTQMIESVRECFLQMTVTVFHMCRGMEERLSMLGTDREGI